MTVGGGRNLIGYCGKWLLGLNFSCIFCCLVWVKVSSFLFCFHCFKQGGKGSLLCCLSFLWVIFILFSLLRVFARSLALLLLLFLSNPSTDVTRCWILVLLLNCFLHFYYELFAYIYYHIIYKKALLFSCFICFTTAFCCSHL